MPIITLYKNEPVDKALKRLSRIVLKEGIIRSVKERRFYVKPSEKKRKAKARAARKTSINKK